MLIENRKYHFVGELTLNRSMMLSEGSQPKDDKTNWLILDEGKHQYSFVYRMQNPLIAEYGKPFRAEMAFTMIEMVGRIAKLNHPYRVLRGRELVGMVKLTESLE